MIRCALKTLGATLALGAMLAVPLVAAGASFAPSKAKVYVAGRQVAFEHLAIAYNDPVAPANDSGVREMLELVQASITWQPGTRFAVITRADGALITLTVGSAALSIGGTPAAMPFAPFYRDDDLYVPLIPLAKALQLGVRGFAGGYVFVPQVLTITPHSDGRRTVVAMTTSAPAAYRASYDSHAGVLRVIFPGFGTDAQGTQHTSGEAASINVSENGPPGFPTTTVAIAVRHGVKFAAHRATGAPEVDAVLAASEMALHLDDGTHAVGHVTPTNASTPPVATATPSARTLATGAPLQPPTPASKTPAPTQAPVTPAPTRPPVTPAPAATVPLPAPGTATPGMVVQPESTDNGATTPSPAPQQIRITAINLAEIPGGGTRLTLTMSGGPVSFEWHRLDDPDNRFWLDIKGVTLAGPSQTLTSALPFVRDIHVSQFALDPEPVVRITISPTQPIDVNIGPVAQSTDQMGIEIEAQPPASDAPKAGVGTVAWVNNATPPPTRTPTQRDLVVIDPGHGGNDPGAANSSYGLVESRLTLQIATRLRSDLQRLGWRVVMTRDGDYEVGDPNGDDAQELQARCDVANAAGARVFVSVHINSSVAHGLNGTTTYYWRPADRTFAQAVQNALVAADGIADDGVKRNNFYVIKHTDMPAVLVETAFLSNSSDAAQLTRPAFLDRLAQGIANGIMEFTGGPQAPL
ncbi:MAG: N-acetylmuramoyl-L-alanine amidase [Candidatus Eremiobacteraeota bacterium]|nr:N-acetylmuramoyl-L-alanine amidase [Candidatus Eremiobacteraeota bacterium]